MRLLNTILSLALAVAAPAAAVAAPAAAPTEPQRRGPVLPVIREDLSRTPDHPRFELRGPVTISTISSSVWSGPVTPPSPAAAPQRLHWSDPVFNDTWQRLLSEQADAWVDRDPGPSPRR